MRYGLVALSLLVTATGCEDVSSPGPLPSRVSVTGVVRDTLGLPIIGTIVAYTHVQTAPEEELQTDDAGRYRAEADLSLLDADTIFVSIFSPYCGGGYGPPIPVDIRHRTSADTVFQLDITLPIQAPRPSPTAERLCAHDRHPDFFFTYNTLLELDSTQYLVGSSGTLFGGRWEHHTSGSTIGDVGSFSGVVTSTAVVLDLTYDTPHAPCGPTERLVGAVLPSGQWGVLQNVSDASCPVGTLKLAFAPY
jgi:hypothetical protein